MPKPEEPVDKPAAPDTEAERSGTVSLVDLIDQIDRKSFRRALEHRDLSKPQQTDR